MTDPIYYDDLDDDKQATFNEGVENISAGINTLEEERYVLGRFRNGGFTLEELDRHLKDIEEYAEESGANKVLAQ